MALTRDTASSIAGRRWKVHLQTLCALGQLDFRQIGAHDYAQLFLVIDDLGLGPESRAQAFRRMTFNVAAANCDDHTKNVSFTLSEGGRWQLSPAYDVTHAHAPESQWTRQHLMAVNGATTGITRANVEEVGQRFGVLGFRAIVGEVIAAVAGWDAFAADAGVPDALPPGFAATSRPGRRRCGEDLAPSARSDAAPPPLPASACRRLCALPRWLPGARPSPARPAPLTRASRCRRPRSDDGR